MNINKTCVSQIRIILSHHWYWNHLFIAVRLCCFCCKHFVYKFHNLGGWVWYWLMIMVNRGGINQPLSCTVWSPVSSALSVSFHSFICSFCVMSFLPSWVFSTLLCWMLYIYNYASISGLPGENSPLIAYCLHPVIRQRIITTRQDVKLMYLWDLLHWDMKCVLLVK